MPDLATWPAVRDVMRDLDVSAPRVYHLIHTKRLAAVATRLGYLVDPESVKHYALTRQRRPRMRVA